MSNSRRLQKVSSLLKREITLIFMNDLKDSLVGENFFYITNLEITSDLQHCKIYISSKTKDNKRDNLVETLNSLRGFIRHILSQRIEMRRVPDLVFKKDRKVDEELSVLKVLDQIREKNNEGK